LSQRQTACSRGKNGNRELGRGGSAKIVKKPVHHKLGSGAGSGKGKNERPAERSQKGVQ